MSVLNSFPVARVLGWAVVLGLLVSLLRDWGDWGTFPVNALLRVLIVAAGGIVGWLINIFAGGYVGMGTNVIESTGLFRFSSDAGRKIENVFIFVFALLGAIVSAIVVS
jgi:hypothetical protein